MNLLKKKKEKSVLYKHEKENYEDDGEEPDFHFKVEGTFTHPLKRNINKGVKITNKKDDELMNTKKEFFGPSVRRRTAM